MKKAHIIELQKFCIHDGPGIRTTVFFQGCHMRCKWCHNPETWECETQLLYYEDRCIGCRECEKICKGKAHFFQGGRHWMDLSECRACPQKEKCSQSCPAEALQICGRQTESGALLKEVMEDMDFYGEEGGVTCSGGEPLLQHTFLKEFLGLCREKEIHTCVDTTLNVPWEWIAPLLDLTDLFLVDIKAMDNELHRKLTGMGNEKVLDNLRRLSEAGKPVILRMPLAGGINDTAAEGRARGAFLKEISNVQRIDCFAVSDHARSKYRAMQLPFDSFEKEDGDEIVRRMYGYIQGDEKTDAGKGKAKD